jgi:O-antigen ligase
VGGTIGSPNDAASYLMLLLPLALGAIVAGWSRGSRLLASAALILGVMALITTQSRGGMILTTIGLGTLLAAAVLRGRIPLFVPAVACLAVLVAAFALYDVILTRFTKDDRGSAYARITLSQVAFRVIADDPVLGCGANNMAVAMKPYAQAPDFRGTWGYVTHDRHLQVWAETGLVGLAAWVTFLGSALLQGWRCWRIGDRFLAPLALGTTMGILGVVLYMFVEVFCGRSQMQTLWIFAALAGTMYHLTADQLGLSRRMSLPVHAMSRVQRTVGAANV